MHKLTDEWRCEQEGLILRKSGVFGRPRSLSHELSTLEIHTTGFLNLDPPSFAPTLFIKAIGPPTFHIFFPLSHIFVTVPFERDIEGPTLPRFPLPISSPVFIPVDHTPLCTTLG